MSHCISRATRPDYANAIWTDSGWVGDANLTAMLTGGVTLASDGPADFHIKTVLTGTRLQPLAPVVCLHGSILCIGRTRLQVPSWYMASGLHQVSLGARADVPSHQGLLLLHISVRQGWALGSDGRRREINVPSITLL